jgi:hypothetical protein
VPEEPCEPGAYTPSVYLVEVGGLSVKLRLECGIMLPVLKSGVVALLEHVCWEGGGVGGGGGAAFVLAGGGQGEEIWALCSWKNRG